jgi:hypothetical protein
MTTTPTDHNPISTGTDVSNLGDYSNLTIKTTDGQELDIQLYGR